MLTKRASRTVNGFAGLHTRKDATIRIVPSDDSGMVRQTPALKSELPESGPMAVSTTARTGYARTSLCLSVLAAFSEGFGAYGMAVYPTADFPLQAILVERRETLQHLENRAPAVTGHVHGAEMLPENIRFGGGSTLDAPLPWYRNLPASIYGAAAAFWAHWRREREIRNAVAALAQFDDRSLRDMGISGRSEIEQVVRYCHDC
jgi:uncharacterized protein YjiS (DUF1127 family)